MPEFVALHCHSDYSLLDGAIGIDRLCERVAAEGQPAIALTDHGVMHGAWELQKTAKTFGIKPILGMEAYVAIGARTNKEPAGVRGYYHLVLLARDLEGYKNLCRLSRHAFTSGFYKKPRIDRELLAKHHEGLIVSSACLAGEVAKHLEQDNWAAAREAASWYANVFKDRYYLEVQAHGASGQRQLNEKIFTLSAELGLPIVATNDSHFLNAGDHAAHDVLLCIGLNKTVDDPDRLHYDEGLYFKSATEMAETFPDRPDVLRNTVDIADQVNVLHKKQYHVPAFPLPPTVSSEDELLREQVETGLRARFGDARTSVHTERIAYELAVINKAGYAGYFLIVADFIAHARAERIPVGPGRGSAAGSLVAFALGITNVDPIKHDLLFERFLNPDRISMPDVDVDFCERRRPEIIEYLHNRYGREAVARIVTFSTLKAKAAIKDVGRALGMAPDETQTMANFVTDNATLAEAVASSPELQDAVRHPNSIEARVLTYAQGIEGFARHAGIHAAGIVIAPGPLEEYLPVCTVASKDKAHPERVLVSQYDMNALEEAGLLKIDVLGLTTLTVLDDAQRMIQHRHGITVDLDTIPMDDPTVYARLAKGDTLGVFQFESALATDFLVSMRADVFEDLVVANALLRPGPLDAGMHKAYVRRKLGQEAVTYTLPELEPILMPTYGVICYQEQVMRVAQTLAGISLAEADVLRKAVGKKDAALIDAEITKFVEKALGRGHPATAIHDIAEQIRTFGRYGFNRSHSVAYSVIAYQTAYLKTHYPAEFYAALATSEMGTPPKDSKLPAYLRAARHAGATLAVPCVNRSGHGYVAAGPLATPVVRVGLGGIREVGASVTSKIVADRAANGRYASAAAWFKRAATFNLESKTQRALVEAGALDDLGVTRQILLTHIDTLVAWGKLQAAEDAAGQSSLFGDATGATPFPAVTAAPLAAGDALMQQQLAYHRLGAFIDVQPFNEAATAIRRAITANDLATTKGAIPSTPTWVIAVPSHVETKVARSGSPYGDLTLEDDHDTIRVLLFEDGLLALRNAQDRAPLQAMAFQLLLVRKPRGDSWQMLTVLPLRDFLRQCETATLALRDDLGSANADDIFDPIKATLANATPGDTLVLIQLRDTDDKVRTLHRPHRVELSTALVVDLQNIPSIAQVRLTTPA